MKEPERGVKAGRGVKEPERGVNGVLSTVVFWSVPGVVRRLALKRLRLICTLEQDKYSHERKPHLHFQRQI